MNPHVPSPAMSHVPDIDDPLLVPVQVAGTPPPLSPVYVNIDDVIEPDVECAPELQLTCVIAQPTWVNVHASSPHVPPIAQSPDSETQLLGGASGGLPTRASGLSWVSSDGGGRRWGVQDRTGAAPRTTSGVIGPTAKASRPFGLTRSAGSSAAVPRR